MGSIEIRTMEGNIGNLEKNKAERIFGLGNLRGEKWWVGYLKEHWWRMYSMLT